MKLAIFGLGRMGANMARRLCRGGIGVVGYNRSAEIVQELASSEGMTPADSPAAAIAALDTPRVVWLMLPAGAVTEQMIDSVLPQLAPGDILIDGGNANFHDTLRRAQRVGEHGIHYMDVGTSGGVWGLSEGYSLMIGGPAQAVEQCRPIFKTLAPAPDKGWVHAGPVGAGHYTKMIHNGIEYGMMQALAEGLALIRSKQEFSVDLAALTEAWRYGSVVRSWLLDLTAEALATDQDLSDVAPVVSDSGEGRWTAIEAIEQGVAAPVMTHALFARFTSQDQEGYGNRLLAMMRNAFGGHAITPAGKGGKNA